MKKILQAFVLLMLCAFVTRAQQNSYNDVAANRNFTIYSNAPSCVLGSCGDCSSEDSGGFYFWQYGLYHPSTGLVWPDISEYNNGTPLTLNLPAGTALVEQYQRTVIAGPTGFGTCGFREGGNVQFSNTIAITFVDDLRSVASLPSSLCQTASAIDLAGYVNKSGATFFVDGSVISGSVLNPAGFSPGGHQISARYQFANGPTTIVLGRVDIFTTVAITANPSNVLLCSSEGTTFTASGAGSGASFQWQESVNGGGTWSALTNNGIYSNVNSATLGVTSVSGRDGNLYRLQVSGACNTVYSTPATLNVYPAVAVTASPANQATCPGGSAVFTAGGTPRKGGLSYQWQVYNGAWSNVGDGNWAGQATISGSATSSITVSDVSRSMNGVQFRCLLRDACGTATQTATSAATLAIYGDVTITGQPVDQVLCASGTVLFDVAATAGTGAVVYRWQQSNDGGGSFTDLSNGSGVYGTYAGGSTNRLTLSSVTRLANGLLLRCIVSDGCGTVTQAASRAASLSIYSVANITAHPSSQTVCPSGSATLSVAGAGTGALSYQWQMSGDGGSSWASIQNGTSGDGAVISGAQTSALSLGSWPVARNGFQFRCVVADACGAVNQTVSNAATITLYNPVVISMQPSAKEICPGSNTTFSVNAAAQNGTLQYQWQLSTNGGSSFSDLVNGGMYSGVNTGVLTLANVGVSAAGFRFRVRVSDNCGAPTASVSSSALLSLFDPVVISSQPASKIICPGANTTFSIAATSPSASTLTYQWQESSDGGTTYNNLTNAGIFSGVTNATLTLTAATATMNNRRYRAMVTDGCGITNHAVSSAAVLNFNSNVSITTHPENAMGCVGGAVTFTVAAAGTGLTYQWQESANGGTTYTNISNTGPYAGATTASLNVSGITSGFTGYQHRAVVTGTCSNVTSNFGTLAVTVPPVITTDPAGVTVCSGGSASFAVTATGTNLTYQWQRSATGAAGTYTDISGANASGYTATPVSTSGYYRVMISNGCAGGVASAASLLTVNPSTTGRRLDLPGRFGHFFSGRNGFRCSELPVAVFIEWRWYLYRPDQYWILLGVRHCNTSDYCWQQLAGQLCLSRSCDSKLRYG